MNRHKYMLLKKYTVLLKNKKYSFVHTEMTASEISRNCTHVIKEKQ